jgi:hypothetical protein
LPKILLRSAATDGTITQRGAAVDQKLILKVTAGNLRQNHLYIRGHLDFFPPDAIGPARRNGNGHGGIDLYLDGLDQTIHTDIPRDAKTGKPRHFFRDRQSIGRFYQHNQVTEGKSATEK